MDFVWHATFLQCIHSVWVVEMEIIQGKYSRMIPKGKYSRMIPEGKWREQESV